jgi:hypothetical protein
MDVSSILSQAFGRVAQAVETPDPVTTRALRFVGSIQAHAFSTWSDIGRTGMRCTVRYRTAGEEKARRCESNSASACAICRGPVCFDHGLFGVDGTVICRSCVEAARIHVGGAGAAPASSSSKDTSSLRRQHLRTLGLKRGATLEQVKSAYRKLAARYHPDKAPEAKKAAATAKFVELGRAKDWLLADLEKE